jgi:predicted transglutaminase-like cysteine proteinase
MATSVLRHSVFGLAAAALGLISSAASAQAMPAAAAASLVWSKSDAILGGPSALQAILAQQHASPRLASVQPSDFALPRLVPAVLRTTAKPDEGVLSGRPDVFGSVALKVSHTPLDARWQHVENARLDGAAAQFANSLKASTPFRKLEAVNWYVNKRVQFEDDQRHFGRPDVWSSASDTLRSGRGDCEDFAIAKMQLLRSAGFSGHDLYLVIVHDLVRRADHAILVARADGRMLVLDNGTDELLDTSAVSDYRPVLTFASYGEWTHGYRLSSEPVTLASNDRDDAAVIARPGDQRSRSASPLAFNTGFSR